MTGENLTKKNELDFLVQLRKNYLQELPERLERLENVLLEAEKQGDSSGAYFNALFREIHSLKGSGGTYGFFPISAICHKFEDYLKHASETLIPHKLNESIILIGFRFADLLQEYVKNLQSGGEDTHAIDQKLARLVDEYEEKNQVKALIVTNSRSLTEYSKQTLHQCGVKSIALDNSYNALLQLSTVHYDILITSAEMPLISGFGLIAALRLSESINKQIPAILVTSNNVTTHIKRKIDPDFMVKKDSHFSAHVEQAVTRILQVKKTASQS